MLPLFGENTALKTTPPCSLSAETFLPSFVCCLHLVWLCKPREACPLQSVTIALGRIFLCLHELLSCGQERIGHSRLLKLLQSFTVTTQPLPQQFLGMSSLSADAIYPRGQSLLLYDLILPSLWFLVNTNMGDLGGPS